jgi:NAD(P)-dependent dehydrogenase (short-subunit alcohol dehydrogenase family)
MAEKMREGSLRGRTAIVTGAGRGLGRAMALGLARAGANVMITAARNQHELDAVKQAAANEQAGAIHTMLADAASEEDSLRVVNRTIREFGSVHILVN